MKNEWSEVRKKIFTLCSGLIAVAILVVVIATFEKPRGVFAVGAEIVNWGLSFPEEGKSPVGNGSRELLKKYNSYFMGDPTAKKIYLTFDAGYENGNTEKILNALNAHKAKATFFLVGNFLETQPDLVKKMCDQGHTVGNHTWSHPDMSKISGQEAFQEELLSVENKYREITGQALTKFYRPPQGKYSIENLKQAQKMGYTTFFWSLAYVDWLNDQQPTPEQAFQKLIPRIHPGAIVLLHNTSKTNGDILDELLTKWEELGFTFGSLSEFLC